MSQINRPSLAPPPQMGRMSMAIPTIGRMSVFTTGHQSASSFGRVSTMPSVAGVGGVNARPVPKIPKQTMAISDSRQLDTAAMASKIFRYLESQPEVPFTITEKKIRNDVITNDFTNLFSFIYRRIDPGFTMGKVDEHVSGFD